MCQILKPNCQLLITTKGVAALTGHHQQSCFSKELILAINCTSFIILVVDEVCENVFKASLLHRFFVSLEVSSVHDTLLRIMSGVLTQGICGFEEMREKHSV